MNDLYIQKMDIMAPEVRIGKCPHIFHSLWRRKCKKQFLIWRLIMKKNILSDQIEYATVLVENLVDSW